MGVEKTLDELDTIVVSLEAAAVADGVNESRSFLLEACESDLNELQTRLQSMAEPTNPISQTAVTTARGKVKELRAWCLDLIIEGEISEVSDLGALAGAIGEVSDDLIQAGLPEDVAVNMQALHARLLARGRQLRRALSHIRMSHQEREPRVVLVQLWPLLYLHALSPELEQELRRILRSAMESGARKRPLAAELSRLADRIAATHPDPAGEDAPTAGSGRTDGSRSPEAKVREASRVFRLISALEEEEEREDQVVEEATFAVEVIVRRLLAAGLETEAGRMRELGQGLFDSMAAASDIQPDRWGIQGKLTKKRRKKSIAAAFDEARSEQVPEAEEGAEEEGSSAHAVATLSGIEAQCEPIIAALEGLQTESASDRAVAGRLAVERLRRLFTRLAALQRYHARVVRIREIQSIVKARLGALHAEFMQESPRDAPERGVGSCLRELESAVGDPLVDMGSVVGDAFGAVMPLLRYERNAVAIKLEHVMNTLQLAYAEEEWNHRIANALERAIQDIPDTIHYLQIKQRKAEKEAQAATAAEAVAAVVERSPSRTPGREVAFCLQCFIYSITHSLSPSLSLNPLPDPFWWAKFRNFSYDTTPTSPPGHCERESGSV